MKYSLFKKGFTLGIIVLFVGTSVIPHISGNIRKSRSKESGLEITSNLIQMNGQIPGYSMDVDWWPMFHHDLNNNGYSTSDAPDTNNVKWSYYLGVSVASPAVADGKVYVGTNDKKVYCLDADTGNQIWNYSTDDGVYLSSPAVADGKVYINEADEVLCLDAGTGSQIWSYTSGGGWSSPAVADGKVYVGSNGNKMYCLDAGTGSELWSYTTGDSVKSSPAVVNGKVYIGSADGNVYCLDADTGSELWSYTTGDLVISSPAVVNGKVYIGSADGNVYCLNADTGTKIWNYNPCCVHFSSPAVAYEKVYIGGYCDGKVYCLDADTGSKIWSYTTGNSIWSSPAIANGKVYIGSNDHKVYCLFAETGSQIWSYPTGNAVISSPAVADENVYVGSGDGIIYCFGSVYLPPVSDFDWIPIYPEPGETVTFDASDSYDPDGTIVLYEWDWDTDGVYDENHTTSTATHVWYEEGIYPVTLRVTDDVGSNDTRTKLVYVGIIPPVADFTWTPQNPKSGETVTFDASDSYDPDGTIILYEWDWDNDGVYDESHTSPIATHSWFQPGNYSVVLRVTDNDGVNDTETKTVNVVNRPPVAKFDWTPTNPISYETVTFDASDSYDPDGTIVLYEWDWDNDGVYDENHTSPTATKTWDEGGNYSVTLRIKDNDDATDTETKTVYVIADEPPNTPGISGPTNGKAGEEYDYTFVTTDPDGDNVSYWIEWGDNNNTGWIGPYNSGEEVTLGHTWSNQGTYNITAKAKDIYDAESEWSELEVSMPRGRAINTPFLNFLQNHPYLFPILRLLLQRLGL